MNIINNISLMHQIIRNSLVSPLIMHNIKVHLAIVIISSYYLMYLQNEQV